MTAIFTIVSANYIAYAATLMQSVRTFHPDCARFIILSDAGHPFGDLDLAAELIACDELGIALIGNMKLWYSVIEFNTALKPFTFRNLFAERGFEQVIYLDPDIELYSELDAVFAALADNSLVLIPHMLQPLQDGKHPSDLSIMKSGVYNLGFAAIRNDADGCALVDWWCERLFAHCRVDVPGNMFTDQRWMDLAPAFVARTALLRHPGYNLAYWNLVHRTVEQDGDGTWRAQGMKLAFFHFSGIDPEKPNLFSKHQNRFTIETLGVVARLCAEYRERVLANGWRTYKTLPYAYGTFGDGKPILDAMRRWVLDAVDEGRLAKDRPLRLGSSFFDAADEKSFADGGRLTRFAHQFWRDRPDLRDAFNLQRRDGLDGYVAWFCDGAAEREGLDPALVHAARRLRDQADAAGPALPPGPAQPPWPTMAMDCWDGPARDAEQWLTGEIVFTVDDMDMRLQRQAALLWERRLDLQHHFWVRDPQGLEDYHLWTLTDGMRERSIRADLFTADYLAWLEGPSDIDPVEGEPPITRAMMLTRRSEHARAGLLTWPHFPLEPKARLEQAFWFVFMAPRTFGWPARMTAQVRAYFDTPSNLAIGGFALTRGMLALHTLREDVQQSFDLETEAGRWRYLGWVLVQGAGEYGVDVRDLCPGIAQFLATPSPAQPLLTRLAELAHRHRSDLQAAFNIDSRAGITGMQAWMRTELGPWLEQVGLASLAAPATTEAGPVPAPYRCTVALTGDWAVASGIGEDLRTAVAALDACGYTGYVIVDLRTRSVITADRTTLPAGQPVQADWNVMFHNADTAVEDWHAVRDLRISAARVAGHWLWELERMPARWIHAFSFCDEIWASSRFVMSVFEAEARRPVRLLHHAVVAPPRPERSSRDAWGLDGTATLFLFMFDFASYAARKNPGAVVEAFRQAFPGGDEHACLLIKTQNAALRPELWSELAGMSDDTRIVFKDAQLSHDELAGLMASADAFVSLHRSEGFGRGPAEAMLLGVPVILTGYSGTADFTDADCACVVGYTLVPVQPGEYPGVEGQRWAAADVAEAARFMRWVHEQPEAAKAMGLRGQRRAAEMLAPAKIGADMLALLRSRAEAPAPVLL